MQIIDETLGAFRSPDLSPFVLHLIDRRSAQNGQVPREIADLRPQERMRSILAKGEIRAFPVFGSGVPVVCFTEATARGVEALMQPPSQYGPWALAFAKSDIYALGGGPALYLRGDEWKLRSQLPGKIRPRAVRLEPRSPSGSNGDTTYSNWLHEREWRTIGPVMLGSATPVFAVVPLTFRIEPWLLLPLVRFDERNGRLFDPFGRFK